MAINTMNSAQATRSPEKAGKADYPDFIGPMAIKELRQGMRARLFVVPFALIHVAAIFALIVQYAEMERGGGMGSAGRGGSPFFSGMDEPIWVVISLLMCCVLPMGAIGLLQQEAGGRNVELLLLTRLTRWNIVFGKWFMMCALGLLTFVSLVPYILARYSLGGMDLGAALLFILHLILLNAVLNAIVIGASGYRNYAMRILIAGITIGSLFFSMLIPMIAALSGVGSRSSWWIWSASALVGSLLYILFGLQLGRARLRLFEHPYEPPASRVLVFLICCAPVLLALASAMTAGFGGAVTVASGAVVGMGILIWVVLLLDRTPKPVLGANSRVSLETK